MASYINMANEIFQSIRPCRYFICCPNIWNPTINMNIIPDALTPTRRLPRPSRRRGEVRRLVPLLPDGSVSQLHLEFTSFCDAGRLAEPCWLLAQHAAVVALIRYLVSCSRIRREQDQLPRCSRGSPGSGHGSCRSLVPTRELVGISTFLLLLKKKSLLSS
jgi:hypothetical protein